MIYGPASGQFLCPPSQYAPASLQTLTNATATLAAVSSANVNTGAFTAPASGTVLVTASFVWKVSVNGDNGAFALAPHGSVTPVGSAVVMTNNSNSWFAVVQFLVTGLTPGVSYNFDLLFSAANSSSTVTVFALAQNSTAPSTSSSAPVVMTVQAV